MRGWEDGSGNPVGQGYFILYIKKTIFSENQIWSRKLRFFKWSTGGLVLYFFRILSRLHTNITPLTNVVIIWREELMQIFFQLIDNCINKN